MRRIDDAALIPPTRRKRHVRGGVTHGRPILALLALENDIEWSRVVMERRFGPIVDRIEWRVMQKVMAKLTGVRKIRERKEGQVCRANDKAGFCHPPNRNRTLQVC